MNASALRLSAERVTLADAGLRAFLPAPGVELPKEAPPAPRKVMFATAFLPLCPACRTRGHVWQECPDIEHEQEERTIETDDDHEGMH